MSQSTENQGNAAATAESNRYFNEYANGIGYLNNIRELDSGRFAAQVSVIQGPAGNVHYEYHDLIISSNAVLGVIMKHRRAIEAEDTNTLVRFHMLNPRVKTFTYKKGKRAGEMGVAIGGYLTRILSMKINGELVHEDRSTFDNREVNHKDMHQVANG